MDGARSVSTLSLHWTAPNMVMNSASTAPLSANLSCGMRFMTVRQCSSISWPALSTKATHHISSSRSLREWSLSTSSSLHGSCPMCLSSSSCSKRWAYVLSELREPVAVHAIS